MVSQLSLVVQLDLHRFFLDTYFRTAGFKAITDRTWATPLSRGASVEVALGTLSRHHGAAAGVFQQVVCHSPGV